MCLQQKKQEGNCSTERSWERQKTLLEGESSQNPLILAGCNNAIERVKGWVWSRGTIKKERTHSKSSHATEKSSTMMERCLSCGSRSGTEPEMNRTEGAVNIYLSHFLPRNLI